MSKLTQLIENDYPHRNTPLQLCFEAEMKRLSEDRDEPMADITAKLAKLSKVSERHIYNYRTGKTEIPVELIKVFCLQFGSTALGQAWLYGFDIEQPQNDLLDVILIVSRKTRNFLRLGEQVIEAFEDNKIDGHERNKLHLVSATIRRDTDYLMEVVESKYKSGRVA